MFEIHPALAILLETLNLSLWKNFEGFFLLPCLGIITLEFLFDNSIGSGINFREFMKVTAIKTKKIVVGDNLFKVLDDYLPKLKDGDIVAIASKIISICQGDVVKNDGKVSKFELIKKEADFYLPEEYVNYGIYLTIKNNMFVASAGVDESNAGGYFILWPKNLQTTTNGVWKHLREKNEIKRLGIVVTDGRITPLRKGVTGIGLSWCGFEPLKDYIGKPDIFGHNLRVTKSNLVDGLAATAVAVTGEGDEQTPLAIISEVPNIKFVDRIPTKDELAEMTIDIKDDVYAGLIRSVKWTAGGSNSEDQYKRKNYKSSKKDQGKRRRQ